MERVVLVALEGGVRRDDAGELECFAWAVVRSPVTGASTSTTLLLQQRLSSRRSGMCIF
jgi:non-canonical (house-cleaning) NTP pyrophosphatase